LQHAQGRVERDALALSLVRELTLGRDVQADQQNRGVDRDDHGEGEEAERAVLLELRRSEPKRQHDDGEEDEELGDGKPGIDEVAGECAHWALIAQREVPLIADHHNRAGLGALVALTLAGGTPGAAGILRRAQLLFAGRLGIPAAGGRAPLAVRIGLGFLRWRTARCCVALGFAQSEHDALTLIPPAEKHRSVRREARTGPPRSTNRFPEKHEPVPREPWTGSHGTPPDTLGETSSEGDSDGAVAAIQNDFQGEGQ